MKLLVPWLLSVACLGLAQAQETEGTLRVVTYNVHGLPAFVTGDDTLARQRLIAPHLERFDVVGLQEDFMDEGHRLLVGAASHGTRLRFPDTLKGRVYGSGLAVLARPRAVLSRGVHYTRQSGFDDNLASKGFQLVRLALAPGVEVDVYNSHMDASGSAGDQAARAAQAAALTESMQTTSRGRAVVFLGDTNLRPRRDRDGQTLSTWLAATGLRCACRVQRDACCARIDRVLVRSGVGIELTVREWKVEEWKDERQRPLSDHAPVSAVVRWRRRAL